jgi:hypothetical protein
LTKEHLALFHSEMLESLPREEAPSKEFLDHYLKMVAGTFDIWAGALFKSAVPTDDAANAFEHLLDELEEAAVTQSSKLPLRFIPERLQLTEVKVRLSQRKQYWIGHMLGKVRVHKEASGTNTAMSSSTAATVASPETSPRQGGAEGAMEPTYAGDPFLSELPEESRDLIAAADLEAHSILEGFQQDRDDLRAQAYELGTSLSDIDFAPGNIALEIADQKEAQGRSLAGAHLFNAASVEWWKWLKPDVEAFIAKLSETWRWAYQKFQLSSTVPEDHLRVWRVWALRERAAANSQRAGANTIENPNNAADRDPTKPNPADLGLPTPGTDEYKIAKEVQEAIQKREEADPGLKRRNQRKTEDQQAAYDRFFLMQNSYDAGRLEKVIRDARKYAESYLGEARSPEARLIVTRRIWNEFIPESLKSREPRFEFGNLHKAIWTEGYASPEGYLSLEERAQRVADAQMQSAQPGLEHTNSTVSDAVATTPIPTGRGRKRGPTPAYETATRMAEVVARIAPDGDWKKRLDEVCTALDTEEMPYPKTWPRRDVPLNNWEDGATLEPILAKKAIEYWLDVAKQRQKTAPETLS